MDSYALSAYLQRWYEQYLQGRNLTAEELCDDVQLRPELERCLQVLRRMDPRQEANTWNCPPDVTSPCMARCSELGPQPLVPDEPAQVFDSQLTQSETPKQDPDLTKRHAPPGYELLGELGRGGMGVVYRARQIGLDRVCALKMILSGDHASPDDLNRFQLEAEALARTAHPNIVGIYDIGQHQGTPYFSLEYCSGGSLQQKQAGAPLPLREAAKLVQILAQAIQVAHDAGIIHRDLKTANILFSVDRNGSSGWQPRITDFGLARRVTDQGQTQTGTIIGTPSYMAPEQARGERDVTPTVDIYALGAVLYECLTGRPPFRAANPLETIEQVLNQEPVAPTQLNSLVPADLQTICIKCLNKEPSKRYPSAQDLADELERWLNGEPIQARPAGWIERKWRWCQKNQTMAALIAVSIVGVASLIGLGTVGSVRIGVARAEKQAAEKQAGTEAFFNRLTLARHRIAQKQPGWTWDALVDIAAAGRMHDAQDRQHELRNEAVRCLDAVDARLLQTIDEVPNSYSIAWHPHKRQIAVGDRARLLVSANVNLIDLDNPAKRIALAVPQMRVRNQDGGTGPNIVTTVAYSPDGLWVVAGTRNGGLHRWDLRTDPPTRTSLDAHTAAVESLVITRDAQAVISLGGTVLKRHDLAKWQETAIVPNVNIRSDLAVHPRDGWIAVGTENGLARLHPETLQPIGKVLNVEDSHLRFAPDGRTIIYGGGRSLHICDVKEGKCIQTLHGRDEGFASGERISDLAISPDGTQLVSTSNAGEEVRLWDLLAGRLVARFPVPAPRINVAFAPSGDCFAVTAGSSVVVYEVSRRHERTVAVRTSGAINAFALGENDGIVCVSEGSEPEQAELGYWPRLEQLTGRCLARQLFAPFSSADPFPLTLACQGRLLAQAWPGDQMLIHNTLPGSTWINHNGMQSLRHLEVGGDGRLWGVVGQKVCAWDLPSGQLSAHWQNLFGRTLRGVADLRSLAAGKRWVVVAGQDGLVRILPAGKGLLTVTGQLTLSESPLRGVALSPDETLALLGSDRGESWLIRVPSAEIVAQLPLQADRIESVSWASNDLIAVGCRDGNVMIWQRRGEKVKEWLHLRQDRSLKKLQFHSDGVCLAVLLANERGVRMWHLHRVRDRLVGLGIGADLEPLTICPVSAVPPLAPPEVPVDAPKGTNGLKAEMFADEGMQRLVRVRYDARVDFEFKMTGPTEGVPGQHFAIRWTGWLRPPQPGRYRLGLACDDGARLWLDGKLCLDQWHGNSDKMPLYCEMDLLSEPHSVRLEYRQATEKATVKWTWEQRGTFAEQVVPTEVLYHERPR